MSETRTHNIVICCDGTWCGSETGTRTNIQILADAFASHGQDPVRLQDGQHVFNSYTNTDVCYFNGVGTSGLEKEDEPPGLMGGFLDLLAYCASGAVASDLPQRCQEAYRLIAQYYRGPEESRIWLFGLSRGAYTVRAVAGMINNCAIIKLEPENKPGKRMDKPELVQKVWDMFWSKDCTPSSDEAQAFRASQAWPSGNSKPPIVFMGLLDTVGAAGLPKIDPWAAKPVTYEYDFRDLDISGEVENVFQACSTHDRLTPFEPCFVRRNSKHAPRQQVASSSSAQANTAAPSHGRVPKPADASDSSRDTMAGRDQRTRDENTRKYGDADYTTKEVWYPGAHYDLGRQDFVFSNQPVTGSINRALNLLRTNVKCLPELADYPLVGYELDGKLDPPSNTPLCIVGQVVCVPNAPNQEQLLPSPGDRQAWQQLVKKPAPPSIRDRVSHLADTVQATALAAVSNPRAIPGMVTSASFSVIGKAFSLVSGPVLQVVGSVLPLPVFQPWYDIDAETKILHYLASFVSFVLTGSTKTDVVLKDRTIPLPGWDADGFDVPPAVFFPVPRDNCPCYHHDCAIPCGNSYASYKPQGRSPKPWFMSNTYETYRKAVARINGQSGQ